jgi:probable F420-dependent oxidoreductase
MSPTSYQTAPPRVGGTIMVPMRRAGSKSDHDTKSRITTRIRDECLRTRVFGCQGGTNPDTRRGNMSKIELGRVGAALAPADNREFLAGVRQLEEIGVSTIWLTGGQIQRLSQLTAVLLATRRARVAGGIIAVDRFAVGEVAALYDELEAEHPGRFVVGLGGAHGPKPIETLGAYLDALTHVPRDRIVLAALGPRMLAFARARASGAFPVLVTPEYTASARAQLGDDVTLAIDQLVVVESDPDRARTLARIPLGFLGTLPQYQANFRRQGFTDDEIHGQADRLVDALVPWGDADAVAAQIAAHYAAGADHVAISVVSDTDAVPVEQMAALIPAIERAAS